MAAKPAKKRRGQQRLTPKQQLFVQEYLIDLNATKAYLRAGYKASSEKTANAAGLRLLGNVGISAAIKKALGRKLKRLEITADGVLQEFAKLAFANMMDFIKIQADGSATVDLSNLTREQSAAIQELSFEESTEKTADGATPVRKVKFRLADKKGSLEMLGRYLKLFNDATPAADKRTAKILKDVLDDKLSVREAAYKFNMLGLPIPEVLKIELTKITPDPPPPELPPVISEEELDAKYQAHMERINAQEKVWVPERQEEVRQLKEELKDVASFGPDATMTKPKEHGNG